MVHPAKPSEGGDELIDRMTRQYREPVRRYFVRRIGHYDEADDLTQELFLRIVRRGRLDDIQDAESFIFQTAANLIRDRQRRRATAGNFLAQFAHNRTENYEVLSPERVLDSKQSLHAALEALNNLDSRCRNAFMLHRLEGLKYSDIAYIYGVSVSAVEKYMIKANAAMARHALNHRD